MSLKKTYLHYSESKLMKNFGICIPMAQKESDNSLNFRNTNLTVQQTVN